jgi:parvulin-like peptidyl-prolyl isomerase
VQREFGNSHARLAAHLAEYGLTLEQYKRRLQRQFVVQQYTYENIRPQVIVRRDELLEYYQQRAEKMVTPGTRELLLIEAPFERFLPAGVAWRAAGEDARAAARLAATEEIRAAQADLATRAFEEVARTRSRGLYAAEGGSWGPIGKPLTGAYAEVSKRLFAMSEGQVSEPIETETGWYIVKCGKVVPESRPGFGESQEKLREEFLNKRFNELASEHIIKLAEKAQISGVDSFIREAVRTASDPAWPAGRYSGAPRGIVAVP